MALGDIAYGPGLPTDDEARLLHGVDRKRVILFGEASTDAALELARNGAFVVAIMDADDQVVDAARERAAAEELRCEFRSGDYADLAFLRADSMDMAMSVWSFSQIADIDRVFRQVHRVLRPNAPLIFSCHHPLAACVAREAVPSGGLPLGALEVRRPYGDAAPVAITDGDETHTVYPRSVADLFAALRRAGFALEQFLEVAQTLRADPGPEFPTAMLWKVTKAGN